MNQNKAVYLCSININNFLHKLLVIGIRKLDNIYAFNKNLI